MHMKQSAASPYHHNLILDIVKTFLEHCLQSILHVFKHLLSILFVNTKQQY